MYKIPHEELIVYKTYAETLCKLGLDSRPQITTDGVDEKEFMVKLNDAIFAQQYGNAVLLVDDADTLHQNVTLATAAGDLLLIPPSFYRGTVYDIAKHTVYLLTRDEVERLLAIKKNKGFNIGTDRFRHYEGRNTLILMGLESDVTVVVFVIELPYRAPVRYITKFENLCILNCNYECIPANHVTEQQLIKALEQTLADWCGLIKVHSPAIHTVRSNVEITEIELYNGTPIPQPY